MVRSPSHDSTCGLCAGLNDRWYDSVVNMMETSTRGLSYSFVGKYATEPMAHLYARMDASFDAVDTTKHKVGGYWCFQSRMCVDVNVVAMMMMLRKTMIIVN